MLGILNIFGDATANIPKNKQWQALSHCHPFLLPYVAAKTTALGSNDVIILTTESMTPNAQMLKLDIQKSLKSVQEKMLKHNKNPLNIIKNINFEHLNHIKSLIKSNDIFDAREKILKSSFDQWLNQRLSLYRNGCLAQYTKEAQDLLKETPYTISLEHQEIINPGKDENKICVGILMKINNNFLEAMKEYIDTINLTLLKKFFLTKESEKDNREVLNLVYQMEIETVYSRTLVAISGLTAWEPVDKDAFYYTQASLYYHKFGTHYIGQQGLQPSLVQINSTDDIFPDGSWGDSGANCLKVNSEKIAYELLKTHHFVEKMRAWLRRRQHKKQFRIEPWKQAEPMQYTPPAVRFRSRAQLDQGESNNTGAALATSSSLSNHP